MRKVLEDFERRSNERSDKVLEELDTINQNVSEKLDVFSTELQNLKQADVELRAEDARLEKQQEKVDFACRTLSESQVQKLEWQKAEDAMGQRIADEIADLMQKLTKTESEIRSTMMQ